ncbi:MAG: hypothetical protein OXU79_01370 [Gemmatimonadota bacterium]|nr:hypothetical protein [Gemmatimonadota bacterium]
MNKRLRKIFLDVLSLPTAPFHEDAVAGFIRTFARRRRIPVTADRYGNIVLRYTKGNKAESVALTAHMDHPGCEILDADGRDLTARWLGACDERHFPGGRLTIVSEGNEIPGRATSALDDDKTFTARAVRPLPNPGGAFGYWGLTPVAFDGDLIRTKGADNLASCAAILAVMDRLNREKADADLWGVFTRAEEVGLLGAGGIVRARTVPKRVPIIVLETSKALPGAEIGGGPVIRVGDAMSVFDPRIEYAIHSTARDLAGTKRQFSYQRQLMSGGVCEATLYVLYNMSVGALAFPLGNYHNLGKRWPAEEFISASDAANMVDLCAALAVNPPVGETRSPMKKRFANSFKSRGKRLLA